MEIVLNDEKELAIIRVIGRVDSNTSPELERRIEQVLDDGVLKLIIDCEELDYITSAGLRILNKTAKRLKRNEGRIVLCSMVDYVREVFEIAGFDLFLPILPDLPAARNSL